MSERDLVQEWLQIAYEDFDLARFVFEHKHPKPLEIICYHCQQSAEKSLKGYLQARGEDIPNTHAVGALCSRCAKLEPSFEAYDFACAKLTLYATHTRYPSRLEIEERDALRAIRWAKEIYELTEKLCAALELTE